MVNTKNTSPFNHHNMKKTFLSLGILSAFAFGANAQDAASASEFKPSAGNITVEVNAFSPFKGTNTMFELNNTASPNYGALRFRYFLSESLALRLQIGLGGNRQKQDYGTTTDYSGNTSGGTPSSANGSSSAYPSYKATTSNTLVSIAPGLEIHKNVSERLSVYYGGYVEFAMQTARGKVEGTPTTSSTNTTPATGTATSSSTSVSGSYTYEVKGAGFVLPEDQDAPTGTWNPTNTDITTPAGVEDMRVGGQRAFTRFGVIGVLGADFYVTKGLYLGLEMNVGLTSTAYKKVTTTESGSTIVTTTTTNGTTGTPSDTTPTSFTTTTVENRDNQFNVSPYVTPTFRLGFWF